MPSWVFDLDFWIQSILLTILKLVISVFLGFGKINPMVWHWIYPILCVGEYSIPYWKYILLIIFYQTWKHLLSDPLFFLCMVSELHLYVDYYNIYTWFNVSLFMLQQIVKHIRNSYQWRWRWSWPFQVDWARPYVSWGSHNWVDLPCLCPGRLFWGW